MSKLDRGLQKEIVMKKYRKFTELLDEYLKDEEFAVEFLSQSIEEETKEGLTPRGERGDFLKTTITISAEMLTELRALGMRRKSRKEKDTDTSTLIREALTDFLKKHRED